jgi:hypothetical protein
MSRCWAVVAGLLAAAATSAPTSAAWPVIRPVHISRTYTPAADSDTPLTVRLESPGGAMVYKLECHNGNYEEMSFINFSGDFQCALYSVGGGRRTSWNLLASDVPAEQGSDSLNRGRMTANQVWGDCGAIPEYGRIRHFRLRGMRITFEFNDLRWASAASPKIPKLAAFTFILDASPDASATSAAAEEIRAPWPGPPCQ